MVNYNNKYKTATTANVSNQNKNIYTNSNNYNNIKQHVLSNNNMNKIHNNANTHLASFNNNNNKNVINDDDDEDLDISDSELIRASQAVESQLKFTNNVHHATSNALNIFSQFNSTTQPYNNNTSTNLMPPPVSTSIYSSTCNSNNNDLLSQNDDLQGQIRHLKTENMQKDGEVKILRDKLKKLEQESQRVRSEREEYFKKLQQQQEDAKRAYQKQIDIKELENQLKSQEIVDLTMKYKVLESTVKRNPNNTVIVQPSQQFNEEKIKPQSAIVHFNNNIKTNQPQQSSTVSANCVSNVNKTKMMQQQQIIVGKGLSTKRQAQDYQSSVDILIDDDDDLENFQFHHENKRPNLTPTSIQTNTNDSYNNKQSIMNNFSSPVNQSCIRNQSSFSNNANHTMISQNNKQIFQNTTNLHLNTSSANNDQIKPNLKPQINTNTMIKTSDSTPKLQILHQDKKFSFENQIKTSNIYKRNFVLNTKKSNKNKLFESDIKTKISDSSQNEKLYELTDLIAESTNYLFKFNSTSSNQNEKISHVNVTTLNKKLNILYEYIKENLKCTTKPNSSFLVSFLNLNQSISGSSSTSLLQSNTLPTTLIIERIDFVINRLNEETIKLINFLISASSVQDDSNNNSSSTIPASSFSIIDLICLAFDIYFNLFLFRISYFLIDKPSLSSSAAKSTKKSNLNLFLISKLTKTKQEFFLVITTLLKSIHFSSYSTYQVNEKQIMTSSDKNIINKNFSNDSSNQTTSTSFSSYSTLKILNKVIDCFNCMLYLPNLNQIFDSDSFDTFFYTSLVDNMHNKFKKLCLIKLIKPFAQDQTKKSIYNNNETKKDSNAVSMIEDSSENDLLDQVIVEYGSENDQNKCFNDEDEEEDDACLFELLYQKLTKYFGNVVYALELKEIRQVSDESNHNTKSNVNNQTLINQSDQMEIITTIAADDLNNRKNIDFKLDVANSKNEVNSPKLSSSRSQSELQFELQSQIPIDEEKKFKFDLINNNKTANAAVNNTNNNLSSIQINISDSKSIDYVSSHAIQFLQIEFLSKFIHYMHNFELYSSLENKLVQKSQHSDKIVTNNQKCLCYKDMLASYLILIDYKFNEKFINGARLCFDELYKMPMSSISSYLDDNLKKSFANCFQSNNGDQSANSSNINRKQTNLINRSFQNNQVTNRFMYSLIIKSCNLFLTLFNNNEKKIVLSREKIMSMFNLQLIK